uniref:Uncharacterized protein n=1 Tax=Arundo donax TaxID=35708 RepID=A0A0A9FLJ3_ARUDO
MRDPVNMIGLDEIGRDRLRAQRIRLVRVVIREEEE